MRNKKLGQLKIAVNKAHGERTISYANVAVQHMHRLSTKSISMDRALGGGFPTGRLTLIRGSESGGKTTTAYNTIAYSQGICANCFRPVYGLEFEKIGDEKVAIGTCDCYQKGLFKPIQYPEEKASEFKERLKGYETNSYEEFRVALIDVEKDFDEEWSAKLGIDSERLFYVQPDTMEQAIDIYVDLLRTAEVDLLVVDSIAAMTPSVEVEESAEKWQQGLQARLMGKLTRKTTAGMVTVAKEYGRFPTQIWINQLREKIGGSSFTDNRVMSAGLAQKFTASVILDMWTSEWEKEAVDAEMIKEFQSEMGVRVRVTGKTLKNKTAPAFQKGSYVLIVAGEDAGKIDELKYFMAQAEKYKLFGERGEGSKKRWFVGDEEFKTKKDAVARMQEPMTYQAMREILMTYMLGAQKGAVFESNAYEAAIPKG